jgi:ATP-dependent exoDNAse (exonuclease V) beta subunit
MTVIVDQAQRTQALNVQQSFIVQAPAGSGKTELLTQRFLALLAIASHPEEIIAITFTKKAANEMRNRILLALEMAAYHAKPQESHKLTTWKLAKEALNNSTQKQWDLLINPNRLKIQTIDSLCASLAKQMPILAQLGSQIAITENQQWLYQQAVDNFLATLETNQSWSAQLEILLLHLDNNISIIRELLIGMLKKREQWLGIILSGLQQNNLREILEQSLQRVIDQALWQAHHALPQEFASELLDLLNFSQQQLQLPTFETIDNHNLAVWQAIANLLLRSDGEFRQRVDKRQGFPSDKAFKQQKSAITALLSTIAAEEQFKLNLNEITNLPDAHYPEIQWQILNCLLNLLPILAAQLQIVFKDNNQIDYTALTQAALQALGGSDNPTELALRLDYKIQHLLVDEFQDTSASQYRLLERLTDGWQPHDGRTLFLVGDPMQSIYRFRAAEVGLFLRTQQHGLGDLELTPLILQVNFRSDAGIVSWINHSFAKIFPTHMNIAIGAVPLSKAVAAKSDNTQTKVVGYQHNILESNVTEADTIIEIIQQADTEASIAILVRSRNQLNTIIPALQQHKIAYQAVEIEALSQQSYIQDLLALTRSLLHFADRTAWLSILRAPWCGLLLNDLHIIAQQPNLQTIWQAINNEKLISRLSKLGQTQVNYFTQKLRAVFHEQQRMTFSDWLQSAWLQLNGHQLLHYQADQNNVEQYFKLVDKLDKNHQLTIENLYSEINTHYAKPRSNQAKVQLMTIHKAKGLEFDIVILPNLEKRTQSDNSDLLIWQERPQDENAIDLLLAPIKSRTVEYDKTYQYIRSQESQKQHYETMRLLYVATTRAKQQLHLLTSNSIEPDNEFKPTSNSFIAMLWPSCEAIFKQSTAKITQVEHKANKKLKRFLAPSTITTNKQNLFNSGNQPKFLSIDLQLIGTLAHELLHKLSLTAYKNWRALLTNKPYWYNKIKTMGIENHNQAWLTLEVIVKNCTNSKVAQWILQQANSKSEYPLTMVVNNQAQHFIIDRTFVENDTRWIVDYKISEPAQQQTKELFLKQQQHHYQAQLNNYAKIFCNEPQPIKLGLYFPLIDCFIEWDYLAEEFVPCL